MGHTQQPGRRLDLGGISNVRRVPTVAHMGMMPRPFRGLRGYPRSQPAAEYLGAQSGGNDRVLGGPQTGPLAPDSAGVYPYLPAPSSSPMRSRARQLFPDWPKGL